MPRSTPLLAIFSVCLLVPLSLRAQDEHTTQAPTQKLFSSSSFAHGYLHGYEMGFHDGDLDLQLAHPIQDVTKNDDYKKASHHFKKSFGDRQSFVKGYRYGFRVGYSDAMGGTVFRAIKSLREVSEELPNVDASGKPILNQALSRGYADGMHSGLEDGRSRTADYRPNGADCELALRFQAPPAGFYCTVYTLGYRMGYSDGFTNQRPIPEPTRIAGEQ